LLDDADSFYAELAREMNLRHDWITQYANTNRYPDAPPLFPDDETVRRMWNDAGRRVFLVTFAAKQAKLDALIPQNKYLLSRYGDKILFSNRPDR